jgi:nicotinate-nucleotide adenylyltransferase
MRIALFGGSFDPPHVAHQMACLYILSTQPVDQVWMMPCYQHPFDKRSAPFAHRVAMCRLAAALLAGVQVCTIEEEMGDKSYTLLTVKRLRERYPEHTFMMVIGADLVRERERWYGWPELQQSVPFLIIGRTGAEATAEGEAAGLKLPAISSTLVREALRRGERPDALVPRAVLDYIAAQGLYREAQA